MSATPARSHWRMCVCGYMWQTDTQNVHAQTWMMLSLHLLLDCHCHISEVSIKKICEITWGTRSMATPHNSEIAKALGRNVLFGVMSYIVSDWVNWVKHAWQQDFSAASCFSISSSVEKDKSLSTTRPTRAKRETLPFVVTTSGCTRKIDYT